jgi:hypothetical protein
MTEPSTPPAGQPEPPAAADTTAAAEPVQATQPAPPAQPQRTQISLSRPAQLAVVGVAGLTVGGLLGLGIGFAAGHHFDGHRDGHGHYRYDQDRRGDRRLPMREPGMQDGTRKWPGVPQPPASLPVSPQPS